MMFPKALKTSLAVAATLAASIPAAQAQVFFAPVRATLIQAPATTTTTVITHTALPTVQVVAPVQQSVVIPSTITRTVESSAVLFSPTIGSISNFRHRLDALRDQIAMGEQSGLMSTAMATDLMSRYQNLLSVQASYESAGSISPDQNDWLEQQINLLNQDVSNAMVR